MGSKKQTSSTMPDWAQSLGRNTARKLSGFEASLVPGKEMLGQTVRGEFLDIDRNPYLQTRVSALQREAMRRGDIESAAAELAMGRLGPGFSVDAARAKAALQRDISQRVGEQIGDFLGSQYQFERGMMPQAAALYAQLAGMPIDAARALIGTVAGTQQTMYRPSSLSQFGQVVAPIAGAALGGMLGPAGSAAGGMIGKKVAQSAG